MRDIYLDNAATTPLDPRVSVKMREWMEIEENQGNPASRTHSFGWRAEKAVENARRQVADLVNCDPKEIIWTSGATESDNLAIKGAARFNKTRGNHIITSQIEHKAVLDSCRQLEREGFEVTYLPPDPDGIITVEALAAAVTPSTILVSLMHVNNEIGVINDIAAFGERLRGLGRRIIFHVDSAQSTGKVHIDLDKLDVDLMSFSGHKTYGPKGIGALYVGKYPRTRIQPQIHGGGHERGMRSGTLATHQIVGMGEAYRIAKEDMDSDNIRIKGLRDRFWNGIKDLEETYVNGHMDQRASGFLNVSFNYIEGESMIMALEPVAVSSGSACTSASLEPSYVLRALAGLSEGQSLHAHSSIRFTLGRFTTEEEVDHTVKRIREVIDPLRVLSPLWDLFKQGIDLTTIEWDGDNDHARNKIQDMAENTT
jgi:cysteine desulfurase